MERLTNKDGIYECRAKDCNMEDYIADIVGIAVYELPTDGRICYKCPMMKIVNRLARYEDKDSTIEN